MKNQFNSILVKRSKRNRFNLGFENKLTAPIGKLIPICTQEVIPGDKMSLKIQHLIKFQPMIAPIMQRLDVHFHAFFVPNRLIWDDWEKFITGGEDGNFVGSPPIGKFTFLSKLYNGYGSLYDYLGFPVNPTLSTQGSVSFANPISVNLLPFRAYQRIYNDYYRDQNLTDAVPFSTGSINGAPSSEEIANLFTLRNKSYSKDYFTSALPSPQRGAAVNLPVSADVTYDPSGTTLMVNSSGNDIKAGGLTVRGGGSIGATSTEGILNVDNSSNLKVDGATASISDFRRAFKVQEWLEKMARGGARYTEQVMNFFGVRSSDARLQRAEYLGGSSSSVIVSEVNQTSQSSDDSVLGNFAGNATSLSQGYLFNKFFEEHGWIMVIMSVTPKSSYFQGIPRKYLKLSKTDYYWPQFAHIGEQEIQNQELYYTFGAPTAVNTKGFGYSPRYAEYRFNNDEVHSDFQSSLEYWHMARKFNSVPPLNSEFMEISNDDVNRVFAVNQQQAHPLLCQFYLDLKASRLISRYGTPHI